MNFKKIFGWGVNDYLGNVSEGGSLIKSYVVYCDMVRRCYSGNKQITSLSYDYCSVCEEWKSFREFKNWFDANYIEGFELDKDILVEGNKIYSPETCRFVPLDINCMLTHVKKNKGIYPTGVRAHRKSFQGCVKDGNGKTLTKTFKTVDEALQWYSETKKKIVKERATRAFLDNSIKSDVYQALVRRKF